MLAYGISRQSRQRQSPSDPSGRSKDGRRQPPGDAQRAHRRRPPVPGAEGLRELEDAAQVGAPEPIDGLIWVANDHQLPAVTRDRLEQPHLRGVGVLILIDEDHREALPQGGLDLR
jgi:hypothetical protein